jgi:hypothetical protein
MSLKDEVNEFVNADPLRAVRISYTHLLVQAVGSILASGGTPDDLRECFDEAMSLARGMIAGAQSYCTAGEALDAVLGRNGAPKKLG